MTRSTVRTFALAALALCTLMACAPAPSSTDVQRDQQASLVGDLRAQVGMPAIHNAREIKQLKAIYEMRDQEGLVTYTYLQSEMTGKLVFLCNSIGYGIPASTQFSAPETQQPYNVYIGGGNGHSYGSDRLPQPEPNGLYSPADAEGTWVTCLGPDKQEHPLYVEPRVIVSPFQLAIQ